MHAKLIGVPLDSYRMHGLQLRPRRHHPCLRKAFRVASLASFGQTLGWQSSVVQVIDDGVSWTFT